MDNPDDLLFTRHVTAHIQGHVDKDKISVSSPDVMARIEPIFEGYEYSSSTSLGDIRGKIERFLHDSDPIDIVDQSNTGQLDEYLPEADLIIWLYLNQKLDLNTFWAVWEYQFAGGNPFRDTQDPTIQKLFKEIQKSLNS